MASDGRASRPRFRLVPTVLLTLAILLVPTAVYAWGRSSSAFTITKVAATGADHVSQQKLRRLLRKEYVGRNLFAVTTDDVRGTLEPLPYVASVVIDRDFPTTLRVRIREHQPVAYVLADERWYVVSAEAYVITAVDSAAAATGTAAESGDAAGEAAGGSSGGSTDADEELATLQAGPPGVKVRLPRMVSSGKIEAGRNLEDPEARLAVSVVAGLTASLRARLAVAAARDGKVTLRFRDGLLAEWGDGDRGAAKSMALTAVLARYAKRGVRCSFIDVSASDRVQARPLLK